MALSQPSSLQGAPQDGTRVYRQLDTGYWVGLFPARHGVHVRLSCDKPVHLCPPRLTRVWGLVAPENRTGCLSVGRESLQEAGSSGWPRTPFPRATQNYEGTDMRGDQVHLNCSVLPRVALWPQAIHRTPLLVSTNPENNSENTYLVGGASTPLANLIYLTLLFRHFLPSNQVPVGCPKNQKLSFALRPFKFLDRERQKTKN